MEVEHTIKKVCSRVDCTGSAVLPKPGSGRPATASACTVCHCKTIFPLVGPTKLQNNVSKTLIVKKIRQLSIVYNYRTLWHPMAKNDVISKKLVHCIFIFWVNAQNMTGWKQWVLVENICHLMKYQDKSTKIGRYMWIWIFNKFANFHAKRLNRSEIFQNVWGLLF